ncbi:AraC family transcriptional regulator [Escherichia albertii]|uniref:AraC family transcriptional regulator n=1 Tax=Escherichia albertii TaxID=208962 RepID=UPI003B75B79E
MNTSHRLELALSLLKQQGNSVGEVADMLNFFDSFHFSKAFKHKFGYAPSAMLKNTDQHRSAQLMQFRPIRFVGLQQLIQNGFGD